MASQLGVKAKESVVKRRWESEVSKVERVYLNAMKRDRPLLR